MILAKWDCSKVWELLEGWLSQLADLGQKHPRIKPLDVFILTAKFDDRQTAARVIAKYSRPKPIINQKLLNVSNLPDVHLAQAQAVFLIGYSGDVSAPYILPTSDTLLPLKQTLLSENKFDVSPMKDVVESLYIRAACVLAAPRAFGPFHVLGLLGTGEVEERPPRMAGGVEFKHRGQSATAEIGEGEDSGTMKDEGRAQEEWEDRSQKVERPEIPCGSENAGGSDIQAFHDILFGRNINFVLTEKSLFRAIVDNVKVTPRV
ncbi:hypothetical protein I350_06593 [Cryptococcus amylolentus CBS 6273]|nr:hypothetical protein I350_06593 [Cryptococcus amylolentus CBS 6273]